MKKIIKLFVPVFMIALVAIILTSCANKKTNYEFQYWNDCQSLTTLKEYVSDVTNEKSEKFIPKEDRIAVFDMDGTLCGELFPTYLEYLLCAYRCLYDTTYEASDELKEVGRIIMEGAKGEGTGDYSGVDDMAMLHAKTQAEAFAGLTINEFETYVKNFLNRDADGFSNMKYSDSLYLPMIEVVTYLQANDFLTYICSGSDRFICRAFACEKLNIPYNQVLGMDVVLKASGQDVYETVNDGYKYEYTSNDKLVRTNEVLIKNLKTNKVKQIGQEIGKQPVLSFGNSSGDTSMHNYTIHNNKYKSAAFMLVADDATRDYGNENNFVTLGEKWSGKGYNVISMKNDFKTIYGENVVKTELKYTF